MKQILQSLRDGTTELAEVPVPRPAPGQLLIRTTRTLVSAGTERMLVEFGKANWIDKARQQPDKVRMVLDKIRTDGLAPTLAAVRSKLDAPLAPGYCNVGVVAALGADVEGFAIGDRVASNGKHAEFVCVPRNLCAHVPDDVADEHAAFTVLGAIALQGIRLANPTLGECVVVTGLGVIGLLAVQMLRAHGCRVLGIDPDAARRALAESFGAATAASGDPAAVLGAAQTLSHGRGVDAVLISASTRSNEPVHQAAQMCRQRGRIVLVGVVGLELSRADFYAKELSFQVSCSYGPGRYDPAYEDAGHDYPVGFVRWTEQRNFEAVLDLMAAGTLDPTPLVSHRFPLERAVEAYQLLAGHAPSLGILLEYPDAASVFAGGPEGPTSAPRVVPSQSAAPTSRLPPLLQESGTGRSLSVGGPEGPTIARESAAPQSDTPASRLPPLLQESGTDQPPFVGGPEGPTRAAASAAAESKRAPLGRAPRVAFIGAGNYASRILIPAFKAAGATLDTVVSASGVSAAHAARKFAFARAASDAAEAFGADDVDAVVIATRHNLHAGEVLAALRAGKHVFCEKPLCLTLDELAQIEAFFADTTPAPTLMVGFNRRFAPQVVKIKSLLQDLRTPASFIVTVNAGAIPASHWTQDPAVGGGRLIGEACHFIDLLRHLAAAPVANFEVNALNVAGGPPRSDDFTLTLRYANGSVGTVHYLANGNKGFPKERLEVFAAGRILQLDNFRVLRGWGWPGFARTRLWRQDKGQNACAAAFVTAVRRGGPSPVPLDEILETSRIAIEAARRMSHGA